MVTKHQIKIGDNEKVAAPKEHQINGTCLTANISQQQKYYSYLKI